MPVDAVFKILHSPLFSYLVCFFNYIRIQSVHTLRSDLVFALFMYAIVKYHRIYIF